MGAGLVRQKRRWDPPASRPSRGRPKSVPDEVQREAIVRRARELFVERGYARSTTQELAARCRISKRTLYRLFPNKAAIFAAAVDAHRQSMLDLPGDYDGLPLADAIERIFKVDIDPDEDRERIAFLRFAVVEAAQFPELGPLLVRYGPEKARILLAEWLMRQGARGRIDVDDPASAAKMLLDMVFGAVVVQPDGNIDWGPRDERTVHVRKCIQVFVNGVRPRQVP